MSIHYEREFRGQPSLPQQPMCKVGDLKCQYTGKTFGEHVVRAYNQYTRDFNATRWRPTQEMLLDNRFNFIHALMRENLAESAA